MKHILFYSLFGYLSGSVLYARVFERLLKKEGMIEQSPDHNPGTANAFCYGGFWCGLLTLVFDIIKGVFPVHLFVSRVPVSVDSLWFFIVLAAPVIGHAFPLFYHFHGGKCIAVTFGCLIGLMPVWQPVILLAVFFVLFSSALKITSHSFRTIAAYLATLVCMPGMPIETWMKLGFLAMASIVCLQIFRARNTEERSKISLLWMH